VVGRGQARGKRFHPWSSQITSIPTPGRRRRPPRACPRRTRRLRGRVPIDKRIEHVEEYGPVWGHRRLVNRQVSEAQHTWRAHASRSALEFWCNWRLAGFSALLIQDPNTCWLLVKGRCSVRRKAKILGVFTEKCDKMLNLIMLRCHCPRGRAQTAGLAGYAKRRRGRMATKKAAFAATRSTSRCTHTMEPSSRQAGEPSDMTKKLWAYVRSTNWPSRSPSPGSPCECGCPDRTAQPRGRMFSARYTARLRRGRCFLPLSHPCPFPSHGIILWLFRAVALDLIAPLVHA